ncbi:MAG TPA: hypothetical protein VMJ32_09070 [Pirellulales bacterium]|nr:hypothetical protein [Pirellulales bacterium]
MKATFLIGLLVGLSSVVGIAGTAQALTEERDVTADYVQKHDQEFSVTVTKNKDGLIQFTIKHNVPRPMYHVAHLAVYHQGQLIAESNTPFFGRKQENESSFSLSPPDIAASKFDFSDSAVSGEGEHAAPVPGTVIYTFRLQNFVPSELLTPPAAK